MTPQEVVSLGRESLYIALLLSAPMLGFGLLAGVMVSIFQAVTSIQEMTLTFIPKILAVVISLLFFFPWMLQVWVDYASNLFLRMSQFVD
jgi:flagellar biosynthetic protein FliQ